MSAIKAIETRYKGYRFRSRLEARWAVFFDALDLDWRYEHQGYVTPYGGYLPDFTIFSKHDTGKYYHVEIKGHESLMTDDDAYRIYYVLRNDNCSFFIILIGDVGVVDYDSNNGKNVYGLITKDFVHGHFDFSDCTNCNRILFGRTCPICNKEGIVSERIEMAHRKARSARFEHGETP